MKTSHEAFWHEYQRLVARILPPLAPGDGVSEEELTAAETRLGIQIPPLLREFYLLAGKRDDINRSHDRLREPEKLQVKKNFLVLYEEHEQSLFWGIDLDRPGDDPPVFQAEKKRKLVWEVDFPQLSEFLIAMLFWQAVNGALPYAGIGSAANEKIAGASPDWERVPLGEYWIYPAFVRDGQLLYVTGDPPSPEIYGAGRTREDLIAVSTEFEIDWDECPTIQSE